MYLQNKEFLKNASQMNFIPDKMIRIDIFINKHRTNIKITTYKKGAVAKIHIPIEV